MPTRKKSAKPLARVHKQSGRERLRISGRQFWLGKAGSKTAKQNYEIIISVWIANDHEIPQDFEWPPKAAPQVEVKIELPRDTSQITIGALVAKHLHTIKGDLTPKQLRAKARWWVARSMANALESRSGVLACEFGPRMLKDVCLELANTPMQARRNGEKVHRTKSQCRKVISEIKRMFKNAVVDELIKPERLVALDALEELPLDNCRAAQKRRPAPTEDVIAALEKLPPVLRDLFRFMDATAARPSEVCRLILSEITLEDGHSIWRPREHKTQEHTSREIPLGPIAREIVDRWSTGKQDDEPLFSVKDVDRLRTDEMVSFKRRDIESDAFDQAALRKIIIKACKAAGVDRWSPYQIRHGALTRYRRETSLDGAQKIAGHTKASITEGYALPDLSIAIAAAEKVG
jgi:integrase